MPSHRAHVTNSGLNNSTYVNPEGDPVEKVDFDNSALDSVDSLVIVSEEVSVEGSVQADEEVNESHDNVVWVCCSKLIYCCLGR